MGSEPVQSAHVRSGGTIAPADATIAPDAAAEADQTQQPSGPIYFDRASIELVEARCWHPGDRMEGSVLVRKALLEGPAPLMEIRAVVQRIIKFPCALGEMDEDRYTSFSALEPFRSEQHNVADHIIYGAESPRGIGWRGTPRDGTDFMEFTYSLLLPMPTEDSTEIVATLPGLVAFNLLVMVSQENDSSNAREAAAIKNLHMTPWDKLSIARPPDPPKTSAYGWPVMSAGWTWSHSAQEIESYPGAPREQSACLDTQIYIPRQSFAAGGTYPVVILVSVGGQKHVSLDHVDWDYLMPDVPASGKPHETVQIVLEAFLEFESQLEPEIVKRVRLPQFDVEGRWSDGHFLDKTTSGWAERSCEDSGWQKPFFERESMR